MPLIIAVTLFQALNLAEAVLWGMIAIGFAVHGLTRAAGGGRRRCLVAAGVLVLFGLSDIVEIWTGAWWRPWWLLVWNGLCVAALLALVVEYGLHRNRAVKRASGRVQ